MPKWVHNTLLVKGPESEITAFKTAVRATGGRRASRRTDLSLQALVRRPGYVRLDRAAAYQWCLLTWGTPWDVRASLEGDGGTILDYAFSSAYAPPLRWLRTASVSFPTLHFVLRYESADSGIAGIAQTRGGIGDDVQNRPGRFFFLRRTSVRQLSEL